MLENLKAKNPQIPFCAVTDEAFASYGRVITDLDVTELVSVAKTISKPESGASYVPGEPLFEALPVAKEIVSRFYGQLPAQVGYCWGYNSGLDATEWHTGNELNVAVTPVVLLLAHRWDVQDGKLDAGAFKAFYLPAGTVVEVFSCTLHYCPCQVQDEGFGCVVALPMDTNKPLEAPAEDKLLFARNKWLIAHVDNASLIADGATPGITGENFTVKY